VIDSSLCEKVAVYNHSGVYVDTIACNVHGNFVFVMLIVKLDDLTFLGLRFAVSLFLPDL
jgi:hypothetical protein